MRRLRVVDIGVVPFPPAAHTAAIAYSIGEKAADMVRDAADRKCSWPHGRGVGGSSIINSMIYTRGNRRDYDAWAAAGNPGWSWDEMLPYHIRAERANIRDFDRNGFHGQNGPLSVEDCPFRSKIATTFIESGQLVGYPYLDYNAGDQIGVSFLQANTEQGRRVTSGNAYLYPARKRPN
uniref:Glucose-methanol-choline oxidoreductase N-terminal domain-containing protein n=1 Tax=Anopheles culicifacies TaxID=139723 RepID=A0A182MDR2_9DIPT